MKAIKLIINEDGNKQITIHKEYDDKTTIEEFLTGFSYLSMRLDIEKYVSLTSYEYYYMGRLPYILTEDEIIWYPEINSILIDDLIRTYGEIIYVNAYTYPWGGDCYYGFKTVTEMWELIYPVFDTITTVSGTIGVGAAIVKWIRSLVKKDIHPKGFFDFINSRNIWNHYELSNILGIESSESKYLLKSVGFKWDNSRKAYVKSERTKEIMKNIDNISWERDFESWSKECQQRCQEEDNLA